MRAKLIHCLLLGLLPDFSAMAFSPRRCKLAFGTFFSKERTVSHSTSYLTIWLGTKSKLHGYGFNPFWHGKMLNRVRAHNATAVYYSYVVAMLARHIKGIQDCDVGSPSLCVHGANFVRDHESLILDTYESYANQTARVLGRSASVVWLMEPDWHQYSERTQRGGGLSQSHMVRLFVQMVGRIKRHLPRALISLDVSPWLADVGRWMAPFLAHGSVNYVHTSGGRTTAGSDRIRGQEPNTRLTWSELHRLSNYRGIIADTGYGIGGELVSDPELEEAWLDRDHLRARIADGVIAVTYANPANGWEDRLAELRATLPHARLCFGRSEAATGGRGRSGGGGGGGGGRGGGRGGMASSKGIRSTGNRSTIWSAGRNAAHGTGGRGAVSRGNHGRSSSSARSSSGGGGSSSSRISSSRSSSSSWRSGGKSSSSSRKNGVKLSGGGRSSSSKSSAGKNGAGKSSSSSKGGDGTSGGGKSRSGRSKRGSGGGSGGRSGGMDMYASRTAAAAPTGISGYGEDAS